MNPDDINEKYKIFIENATVGVWFVDEKGDTVYVNDKMAEMLGYETKELMGQPFTQFIEDKKKFYAKKKFEERKQGKKDTISLEFLRKDNAKLYALMHSFPIFDEEEQFRGAVSFITNISDMKQIEHLLEISESNLGKITRSYKLLSECNMELVKNTNERELFQKICDLLVEIGGYHLAWVALIEQDAGEKNKKNVQNVIRPVAYAQNLTEPPASLESLKTAWIEKKPEGPIQKCLNTGDVIISRNILMQSNWIAWKKEAAKKGYRSSAVIPLRIKDKNIGSLNIYSKDENAFYDKEVDLLNQLANNLAFGIEKIYEIQGRQRIEEELKESEKKYKTINQELNSLLNNVPIYIYYKDLEDKIIYANQQFADTLNLEKEEIIGKKSNEIFPEEMVQAYYKYDERLKESKKPIYNIIEPIPLLDEKGWALTNLIPRFNEDDELIGIIVSAVDITSLKKMEKKWKKSRNKYKEAYNRAEFYRDLFAHDINNILQGILSAIQLLELSTDGLEDHPEISDLINSIEYSIKKGSRLVKNIQKFSLIEDIQPDLNEIDALELLTEIKRNILNRFPKHKIKIQMETELKHANVMANYFLEDVFDNLLLNAVDHNDSERIRIFIRITKEKKRGKSFIKFEFMDNGRGIEDAQKERVFLRGDIRENHSYGRGLGLSLVKKIIDSYDGEIWIENRVKNDYTKGSNFIVLIPASH
ncbi:MAG: PAS domain S-box protein [Promethearchaeia archaeon]